VRAIILTCEHASNQIPLEWRYLFEGQQRVLDSHQGYDIGSLAVARQLAKILRQPLYAAQWSRLLIDLNRSPGHPRLFSEFTRPLSTTQRSLIIEQYYRPHRDQVTAAIDDHIGQGYQVLHIGVHSFVPQLGAQNRNADIGLLYDPTRLMEQQLCIRWQQAIRRCRPDLRVRRNYPYTGIADGFIPALRKKYDAREYLGVELEIIQNISIPAGELAGMLVTALPADTICS
jgi:predicted N-formylglutamate amidohydrolase